MRRLRQTGQGLPLRAHSVRHVRVVVMSSVVMGPVLASWKWYERVVREFAGLCGIGPAPLAVMAQFRRLGMEFQKLMARVRGILSRPAQEMVPMAALARDARAFAASFRAFRAMQWDAVNAAPGALQRAIANALVRLDVTLRALRGWLEHPQAFVTGVARRRIVSLIDEMLELTRRSAKRALQPAEFEFVVRGIWDLLEGGQGVCLIGGYSRLRRDLRELSEELSRLWMTVRHVMGGSGNDVILGGERFAADVNRVLAEAGVAIRVPVRWHSARHNVSVGGSSGPESQSESDGGEPAPAPPPAPFGKTVDQLRLSLRRAAKAVDDALRILSEPARA